MADYKNGGNQTKSRHLWEAHIRAQQKSGLSRAEYCRRHDLSYHALTYRQRKISEPSNGKFENKKGQSEIKYLMRLPYPRRESTKRRRKGTGELCFIPIVRDELL